MFKWKELRENKPRGRVGIRKEEVRELKWLRRAAVRGVSRGKAGVRRGSSGSRGVWTGADAEANASRNKTVSNFKKQNSSQGIDGSLTSSIKYIRNESLQLLIESRSHHNLSKQAVIYLAAGLETLISEIISSSYKKAVEGKIGPQAIATAVAEDPELCDIFGKGMFVHYKLFAEEGRRPKLTGYPI
jgi:hypothetical protein